MAFEMEVSGFFGVEFQGANGRELDENEQRLVLNGLKDGDFVANMQKKTIYDLDDLKSHIYRFEIVNTEGVEYDWNEVEL